MENKELGAKVTLNSFLREETHRYNLATFDDDTGEQIAGDPREFTICVVADNSTVTIEALEGREYADPSLQGLIQMGCCDQSQSRFAGTRGVE